MPTGNTPTASTAWTAIGTGLAACLLQPSGNHWVYIGSVAPAVGVLSGLHFISGELSALPNLAALGGGVWVRSIEPIGGVAYAAL